MQKIDSPSCPVCKMPLAQVLDVDTPEHFAGRYVCGCGWNNPKAAAKAPGRALATLAAEAVRDELFRQANDQHPTEAPYVRDSYKSASKLLVDGHVDVEQIAAAVLEAMALAAIDDAVRYEVSSADLKSMSTEELELLLKTIESVDTRTAIAPSTLEALHQLYRARHIDSRASDLTLNGVSLAQLARQGLVEIHQVRAAGQDRSVHRYSISLDGCAAIDKVPF